MNRNRRKTMLTQAPRGTKDVLPAESYRWQHLEAKMRAAAALAGYREPRCLNIQSFFCVE